MDFFNFFDFFLFFYIFHFIFCQNVSLINVFWNKIFGYLVVVFGYNVSCFSSYFFSFFVFFFLMVCTFGGYFSYSICVLGVYDFTFFISFVCWLSTFLFFISSTSFIVYLKKPGDGFFKTLFLFFVEIVSELSRPIALSVRLYANIMVGHAISGLFYYFFEYFFGFSFIIIFPILLECFVFVLQSYIFSRLIYLYMNE
uniref:ATP synthase subunit a n=1 Tax=Strongyloides procyonis TaxID=315248 RepID=A0A6J4CWK6_9BILA|nr:ATPase subunit 6 [Strongyloides procyonis]